MLPFYPRGLGAATPGASDLITAAALKYGVDPTLALALAKQESGLNQNAVSSAGAVGVMQLMPGTAADLGVNPYDLQQNIDGGVRYLSQQLRTFGGDTSLALAAYNAGPGAVQKYGAIPPYPETQNYVASILASVGAPADQTGTDASVLPGEMSSEPAADNTGLFLAAAAAVAAVAILA